MLGLRDNDIEYIINQVKEINEIEKVVVFGSRAKGINKYNSDIDIVVYGEGISKRLIFKLYELLEENAPYPYLTYIVHYEKANDVSKKEINDNNVVLYNNI